MSEASSPVIPDVARLKQVFEGFKEHFNANRVSTELTIVEILRESHPESEITCISPGQCDLLGYAAAGHATAKMDSGDLSATVRSYHVPVTRSGNKLGTLRDLVLFGRWSYSWMQSEYLLFEIHYEDHVLRPKKVYFVLSPRTQFEDNHGRSAINKLLLAVGKWSTELHNEIYVFDDGYWTKNNELWKSVKGSSWDEVILNHEMKANLMQDVQGFFDNQQMYKKLSAPWKRGLIFHGIPGNGKTISIRALINELSTRPEPVPSLYVKSFDSSNGKKSSIRSIFTRARSMAPCLLIFEDLDSLVEARIRSYFLNEVDGLEANEGILMIGTTNHLGTLDPAISKRPSRFDRKYHFKIPSENERTRYCQFWRSKLNDSDTVDFPEEMCRIIAKMTDGFSFAYLKELFVATLLILARDGDLEEYKDVAENDTMNGNISTYSANAGEEGELVEGSREQCSVPDVEIPSVLRGNLLLKVIRNQIRALVDEMDNTND